MKNDKVKAPKLTYEAAKMEVIAFETEDVIRTSGDEDAGENDGEIDWG